MGSACWPLGAPSSSDSSDWKVSLPRDVVLCWGLELVSRELLGSLQQGECKTNGIDTSQQAGILRFTWINIVGR